MKYYIENNYIKACVDSYGAQLIELITNDGINRLHSPNKDTWDSVSPILFPQVSRMKNFTYSVNGVNYNMPLHGFLRNMELNLVKQTNEILVFYLKENDETLKMYPYQFEIFVKYELIDKSLKVSFDIKNTGNSTLRYMIGGHPGLRVPLFKNEKYEDYYLKFPFYETVDAMQVVDGFLANVYKPALINQDIINLKHDLFIPDAIVMRGLKSPYVDLISKTNDKITRFHFSDFEILAIWSLNDSRANYVCLEPWNGIQKDFVVEHEKMGVLTLKSNESKEFSYIFEIIK